jgi:hypothetical protein
MYVKHSLTVKHSFTVARQLTTHYASVITVPGGCPEESRLKKTAFLALCLAAPMMSTAAVSVNKPLSCEISATQFFQPLVQRKLINLRPYYVEDSVNFFRLSSAGFGMQVYGMKVTAVLGYASGQLMFERGPGTEPPDTYGVIVKEQIANVQATLNSEGATSVRTRRISPSETAIFCEGT